ncbi:amino acid racemase [Candidatus Woesearchaeota archaeon]|nr:amino acid racemase [Candidatus Woesearchaeota archaeon]
MKPMQQNKKPYKTIGILGGMGPEATADLYLRIIRIFQQEYAAVYDDEFPEIIIWNLPIPDVVENPQQAEKVRAMLIATVKKMEEAGAALIGIPCNSVMAYLDEMRAAASIPVLSIPEEVAKEVQQKGCTTVGVLGTMMTINSGVYSTALENAAIVTPDKEQQELLTRIILNILAGKKNKTDKDFLNVMIAGFQRQGAEQVILGCTELPLLIEEKEGIIDTLSVLARAIVRSSIGEGSNTAEVKP